MKTGKKWFGLALPYLAFFALVLSGFGMWLTNMGNTSVTYGSGIQMKSTVKNSSRIRNITKSFSAKIKDGAALVFDQCDAEGHLTKPGSLIGTIGLVITMEFNSDIINQYFTNDIDASLNVVCNIEGSYENVCLCEYVQNPVQCQEGESFKTCLNHSHSNNEDMEVDYASYGLCVTKNYEFRWGDKRDEIIDMEAYNLLKNTLKNSSIYFSVNLLEVEIC